MSDYLLFACVFCCGIWFGNFGGDQATFRDCAVKGKAHMVGGGVINCGIKGET